MISELRAKFILSTLDFKVYVLHKMRREKFR